MTLHMLQMAPDIAQLVRWAGAYGVRGDEDEDDLGYALHAALHAAFGRDLAPKPFAFLRSARRTPQPAGLLRFGSGRLARTRGGIRGAGGRGSRAAARQHGVEGNARGIRARTPARFFGARAPNAAD